MSPDLRQRHALQPGCEREMLASGESWKRRLYDGYVSGGQAGPHGSSVNIRRSVAAAGSAGKFVLSQLPPDRALRIADLGCGQGVLLEHLLHAGYKNVTGVDISAEQIALARASGITEAQEGGIAEFLEASPSESIDTVLMIDILEHLTPNELFGVLDEVFRVLRRGGTCLARVPNGEGLFGMRIRFGDLTHEQAFTQQSMAQLFRACGFGGVRCQEDAPIIHGFASLGRNLVWKIGTLPYRLLLAAETGPIRGFLLTQNIFVRADRLSD